MSKETLLVVETIANEIGLLKEDVFGVLEQSVALTIKEIHLKDDDKDADVKVEIDRKTGDLQTWRNWSVVDDDVEECSASQVTLSKVKTWQESGELEELDDKDLEVGFLVSKKIEVENLSGRISSQKIRYTLKQKLNEIKRIRVAENYRDRIGELVSGTIKEVKTDSAIISLADGAEGVLPRRHTIKKEIFGFRVGNRLKALLFEISEGQRGPSLILDRKSPDMLRELFRLEVPEVQEGSVEIKAVVRVPGEGAKIAVKTQDSRIDAVGTCIGMRGSRVQVVSNELNGERVDVILWEDDLEKLIVNALVIDKDHGRRRDKKKSSVIKSIFIDDETNTIEVGMEEDKLKDAIGREGINVKLACELIGWRIKIMRESDLEAKKQEEEVALNRFFRDKLQVDADIASKIVDMELHTIEEVAACRSEEYLENGFDEEVIAGIKTKAKQGIAVPLGLIAEFIPDFELEVPTEREILMHMLEIDDEITDMLLASGFKTIEDVAYDSDNEMLKIEFFTDEISEQLRERAVDVLSQLKEAEKEESHGDLYEVPGMDSRMAGILLSKGVNTREDLAYLATYELLELVDNITENEAGKLIMSARSYLFKKKHEDLNSSSDKVKETTEASS